MDILRGTNIDFMKYRKFWVWVSIAMVLVGLVAIFAPIKLNMGIDFKGGTQLTLKFQDRPAIDELRTLAESAGARDVQIQSFGRAEENEVMVRTSVAEGTEEGTAPKVLNALNGKFNAGLAGVDLNQIGTDALITQLQQMDPLALGAGSPTAAQEYDKVSKQILAARKDHHMLTSFDQITGVDARVIAKLKEQTHLGRFAVLSVENVGPQVGSELRKKGLLAVFWSLAGMLVYIWFRFELEYGVGATMATIHDILVTIGLFAIFGFEWNLTTIAAFLTLIGYSVNDTVVTFDRLRENLRKSRGEPLIDSMNKSINQTLSRTILTGGTVILAAGAMLFLGGDVLRGIAFVLFVGVIVGTYSSIYVASPFALAWATRFGQKGKMKSGGVAGKAVGPSTTSPRPTSTGPAKGAGNGKKAASGR
ncbi:MAG: protein translocase subunit SecF [Acidobacteriota bacterium]